MILKNSIVENIRNKHGDIFKVLLFIATIFLVVYFFPRKGQFKFEFQKSRPWQHEDLYAPFDFAIVKSEKELASDEARIAETATYYFRKDEKVENASIQAWKTTSQELLGNNFPEIADSLHGSLIATGETVLRQVYNRGIVRPDDRFERGETQQVLIEQGNFAFEKVYGDFLSIRQASEFIDSILYNAWTEKQLRYLRPALLDQLDYNITFDYERTVQELAQRIEKISPTRGMVVKGEQIIQTGEVVDEESYQKLISLRNEYEKQLWAESSYNWILLGQIVLVSITVSILFFFLLYYRNSVYRDNNQVAFILINLLLMVGMGAIIVRFAPEYLYLAPFCLLPLILRAFFDMRLAMFTHLVTILLIGFIAPNSFEFIFIELIAGIISILTVKSMYKRADLFISVGKIISIYIVGYFGIAVLQEGSPFEMNYTNFLLFAGAGFLTLLANPLIYMFEKTFNLVSDVSLLELSDTNSKLLRRLAEKAPGTFQHSLQVANLAESAIQEIGGNALLTRTAALYHDIGKTLNPLYFIENQATGVNPHDDLSFEDSARIIIEHVTLGVDLAKKHKLPDRIIDFIRTHHGTSLVQYFYRQYVKSFPDEIVDEKKFSYPGPKPFSKETAVLMMADSCEAASRSLSSPDAERVGKLVDSIIDRQMEEGQFSNAEITLREINTVRKILKKKLLNIYHLRIEYPE